MTEPALTAAQWDALAAAEHEAEGGELVDVPDLLPDEHGDGEG